MRLTKIYTKVGDKGTTLLATGERVSKSSARIEAYGTVDELNAVVGVLNDTLRLEKKPQTSIIDALTVVQHELFDLGAELSIPDWQEKKIKLSVVGDEEITRLEQQIDQFNEGLEPLANFILPGGCLANAHAHVCRTVCRRAERRLVSLASQESVRPETLKYLNRLSDWFFVLGRIITKQLNAPEVIWKQRK